MSIPGSDSNKNEVREKGGKGKGREGKGREGKRKGEEKERERKRREGGAIPKRYGVPLLPESEGGGTTLPRFRSFFFCFWFAFID